MDPVTATAPSSPAPGTPAPGAPPLLSADPALAGPLADPDNLGPGYLRYREEATTDELLARARARQQPQAGPAAAPAGGQAPAEPANPPETSGHASPEAIQPAPAPAAGAEPLVVKPAGKGAVVVSGQPASVPVGAIAKDVALGAIEAPKQALAGVSDAVGNTLLAADDLAGWLNNHLLDTRFSKMFGPEGAAGPDFNSPEFRKFAKDFKTIPNPDSVTGGLIRGTMQFLTGLKAVGPLVAAAGAGPVATNIIGGGVSSAVTMSGEDAGLSNLIQSNPKLANPITAFLATDPNDNEAYNRMKHGLEGLGLGLLAEGLARGVRFVAAGKKALVQEGARPAPNTVEQPALNQQRDFLLLGDPNAPLLDVRPKPYKAEGIDPAVQGKVNQALDATGGVDQGAAAKAVALDAQANRLSSALGAPVEYGNKQIFVNFARINAPDDVKTVLGQMTEAFSGDIEAAQRGVRSNEATQKAADALGMTVDDVLKRRRGQGFNAEEALAARQLLAASGTRLLEAAQKAASPGASPADQFVFRKMMATHYAIQAEVIGARTETARALQAWSIPAGGGQEQMKALEQILQGAGGSDVSQAMAKRLAILAQTGADAATLNQAIRKGAFATTMDAVREVWINGLLSSPTTHIVNSTSNFNVAMQQIYERGVAGKIAKLTGSGGVAEGEATAMMYGLMTGLKDSFRAAGKALRSGDSGLGIGKMDAAREPAVSAGAFNLDQAGGVGRVVDLLGATFRVPGRLLETEDAFFKSIGYRMELHAQAYRQAVSEGLEGVKLGERVAQIVTDPPENIRLASADAALYSTFTNETGDFGKNLMRLRNGGGAMNPLPFILPFVKTPINISRYSFERTPLAPLVGQWRADIAAGGARKDLALARLATGSAAMALATDLSMNGLVSGRGPSEAGERQALLRSGWQPYSVKVGDKWVSYNRLDPLGQTLGFAADFTEAMTRGELDPADVDEWGEVMAGGIAAVSQFTIQKTYLSGLADFMNVMTDGKRYGVDYVDNFVSSFLPFTSAVGAAERLVDPTTSIASTPMEAIMAKLPGLSARLTKKRDLWGAEIKTDEIYGRAFDVLSPAKVTKMKTSPIDAEMLNQRIFQEQIKKKTSFAGVDVNLRQFPEIYDAYVRLAGNELKHPAWRLGAKDFLDAVVSGKHPLSAAYRLMSDGPGGGKERFIKDTIQEYRNLAQDAILADPKFAAFAQSIGEARDLKARAEMPNPAGAGRPSSPVELQP